MRVIIGTSLNRNGSRLSYMNAEMASRFVDSKGVGITNKMLAERALREDRTARAADRKAARAARSVTVNLVESPLGWLRSRCLISARHYDAGEQLRADWSAPSSRLPLRCVWTRCPGVERCPRRLLSAAPAVTANIGYIRTRATPASLTALSLAPDPARRDKGDGGGP
jgi:hypothetical protein